MGEVVQFPLNQYCHRCNCVIPPTPHVKPCPTCGFTDALAEQYKVYMKGLMDAGWRFGPQPDQHPLNELGVAGWSLKPKE